MRSVASLASVIVLIQSTATLGSERLTCSVWQGIRTCTDAHGYVSHETQWQGMNFGDDNQSNRWTTSRWQGFTTTTTSGK
jgi:hypothetical protein